MIDPLVLKYFKTDNEQLRRFFTAKPAGKTATGETTEADALYTQKDRFTKWVAGLIEDGRRHCFANYRHFAAVEMMMDSQPTLPENVPLMAYAQGKINIETVAKELTALNCADEFIERRNCAAEGQAEEIKTTVNIPRLYEVCVNIGRSFISKRVNAQANKYNSLRPFMQFNARGTRMTDHLRGDAMSQYAEIMADAFGYRHEHTQCIRGMLNYRTVQFPTGAWECDTQTMHVPDVIDGQTQTVEVDGQKLNLKTVIQREGVRMVRPSPARVLYDTSKPLSSINTDTGCRWIGFWDVQRFGDIAHNTNFFNTANISWANSGHSVLDQNRAFFDLIFAGQPINFPTVNKPTGPQAIDFAAKNERTANAYLYALGSDDEKAVFVTDLRLKVVPKEWGMGDYPHPVWLRIIVAADDTIIFAEWLPSLPAVYWGHNEDDNRLMNISQAHEIMPWQDQLSNVFSQMLMKLKHSLLRVIVLNTDVFPANSKIPDAFEKAINGPGYYINPHLLRVSFKGLEDMQLDIDKIFKVVGPAESSETDFINNAFKAIVQILAILERLMNLSPQEQGQPMPREASAEEISALESSTQVTYNAISASIDEARAAWKRIIYESAMAHASNQIFLPVSQRFSKETIQAAGFEIRDDPDESAGAAKKGYTVIGQKKLLVGDYIWTSRDGGDRYTNKDAANTLVALLGQVLPLIGPEAFGKKRIFEIVNEIFRLLASYDLKLEMAEAEQDGVMAPQVAEQIQALQQALQEQEKETGGLADAIDKIGEFMKEIQQQLLEMQQSKLADPAA